MANEISFDSIDFITIGTIGAPGQRVFHLQFAAGEQLVTLILEKEQAAAISASIKNVLQEIEQEYNRPTPESDLSGLDLELREPILPSFRVAQIGLGYDEQADRIILMMNELQPEDSPEEPQIARLLATREQMQVLAAQAARVVVAGRPTAQSNGKPRVQQG